MSGRKNVIVPIDLIVDGDMSGDITGGQIKVQYHDNIGLRVSWAGTSPVGVVQVQASLDDPRFPADMIWSALTFDVNGTVTTDLPVSGNSGDFLVSIPNCPYPLLRAIYDRTSGTGTVQVKATGKEI